MIRKIKKLDIRKLKIFCIILVIMLTLVISIDFALDCIPLVKADSLEFEKMDLEEELESIDGFDFGDYPFDSDGDEYTPRIFNFVEYCYSFRVNQRANYGLYIYFYNPQALDIREISSQNKISIGTAWEKDSNGVVRATNYEMFNLQFVSKIESGAYANLFYKFKVVDRKVDGDNKLGDLVNSNERRYDVAQVQLVDGDNQNATPYTVGCTYKYKGYAKGYGPNKNDNTLSWEVVDLETIRIKKNDISFSCYTMENSNGTFGHYDQIFSVYFNIPNKILNDYGTLQKIHFEYYQYRTSPMIITKDKELYDKLNSIKGKRLSNDSYVKDYPSLLAGYDNTIGKYMYWTFNPRKNDGVIVNRSYQLPLIFYENYNDEKNPGVTSERLSNYIISYNSSNYDGYIYGRSITKDLFMGTESFDYNDVYKNREIDAGENYNLYEYNQNDWMGNLWASIIGKDPGYIHNFAPIVRYNSENLDNMYIDENDYEKFRSVNRQGILENKSTHIFRFGIFDYLCMEVFNYGELLFTKANAYLAQTTACLDFNFIDFTFNKEGVMTVIPVVMEPMDLFGNAPPRIPPNIIDIIMKILSIIIGCIIFVSLILLLFKLLPKLIPNVRGKTKNNIKIDIYDNQEKKVKSIDNKELKDIEKERKKLRKRE